MLTLYGFPNSRSLRAAWALEEAGAEYAYVKIDLMAGEGRRPEFLKVNPGGKVPALVEDDFVLTESAAIVTYVGDRFPDSGLVPEVGSQARAVYNRWCFFAIGELEQPLWTIAKHRFVLPEAWRVPAVIDTAIKEFEVALQVLAEGLGDRPFILGDTFTGADILIARTLGWASKYELLPASAQWSAYLERTLTRPAFGRACAREAG